MFIPIWVIVVLLLCIPKAFDAVFTLGLALILLCIPVVVIAGSVYFLVHH